MKHSSSPTLPRSPSISNVEAETGTAIEFDAVVPVPVPVAVAAAATSGKIAMTDGLLEARVGLLLDELKGLIDDETALSDENDRVWYPDAPRGVEGDSNTEAKAVGSREFSPVDRSGRLALEALADEGVVDLWFEETAAIGELQPDDDTSEARMVAKRERFGGGSSDDDDDEDEVSRAEETLARMRSELKSAQATLSDGSVSSS